MRILIHWSSFPAYAAACVAELRRAYAVETLVLYDNANRNAPFERSKYQGVGTTRDITSLDQASLKVLLEEFAPDVALIGGWKLQAQALARLAKASRIPTIVVCDNIFLGSLKQRIFPLYRKLFLARIHDRYWVPGERATRYLVRSGVDEALIWRGVYAPDTSRFQGHAGRKPAAEPAFLFMGQYVPRKGLPELLQAFSSLQTSWKLLLCGSGELKPLVAEYAAKNSGVVDLGFVQPDQVPEIVSRATAFVLPSREDHWPLAIVEAASAGLPIVCSDACGNIPELVKEGQNGFVFSAGNASDLLATLRRVTATDPATLGKMGARSVELASAYTPAKWAEKLFTYATSLVPGKSPARAG